MKRLAVGVASGLIALAIVTPFAVLQLPAVQPLGGQPGQMSAQELLVVGECSILFYAVFYFAAKIIFAASAMPEDLAEVKETSRGHMHLLHIVGGMFIAVAPWLRPAPINAAGWFCAAAGVVWVGYEVRQIRRERSLRKDQPSLEEQASLAHAQAMPVAAYFTDITFLGCNLLGILNVFVFFAGLMLPGFLGNHNARTHLAVAIAVGLMVCPIADIAWRLRRNSGARTMRLLSPHAGGALVFIPVWIAYLLLIVAVLVAALRAH